MSVAIITDSAAALPRELEVRYGILIVPMWLTVRGEPELEGTEITPPASIAQKFPHVMGPILSVPNAAGHSVATASRGDSHVPRARRGPVARHTHFSPHLLTTSNDKIRP